MVNTQKTYRISILLGTLLLAGGVVLFLLQDRGDTAKPQEEAQTNLESFSQEKASTAQQEEESTHQVHPMNIEALSKRDYPGGEFVIEEELSDGMNYTRSVVSYQSEGLKIYGLLTVPHAQQPEEGFPAVVFVHGYIPPKQYSTIENYPTYQARLARAGFVTFKPDLRGHGNSEGEPVSAHFSEKYVIDTLYALAYMQQYDAIDPDRVGYWGHSNGGEIGLRIAVTQRNTVQAYSLWAGVVGSFEDMLETHNADIPFLPKPEEIDLVQEHGLPSKNPDFWSTIDPYAHLENISKPIQLQHGTQDESVPLELSDHLEEELENLNKDVIYSTYPGDDHNISQNVSLAWERTIEFFEENL